MEGWIKLHRSISHNEIWTSEPFSRGQAFVDLILLASHKDSFFYKRGVKVKLKRGQLAWGEISLSERWKWSRNKLRKFLNDIEKEQQIEQQKSQVISVITIVNYNKYQEKGTTDDTTNDTTEGTTDDTTERHIQECKENDKKEKNEKTVKEKKEGAVLIFPFDSEKFKEAWSLWKAFKKEEHNFTYKGIISEQAALKKLSELSLSDEEKAIAIIHQSISEKWKGLFELKNKKNEQFNTSGQVQYSDDFKKEILRKLQS